MIREATFWNVLVHMGKCGKKCSKPSQQAVTRTSPPPFRECQYGNNTFQKLASLYRNQCTFCRWSQRQCEIWLIQWRAQWVLHHTHRQPWRGKLIFIKCIIRASVHVFRQIKATLFTIFVLEWWPPNTSTMRATRQEEPAPGNILYLVVACLS